MEPQTIDNGSYKESFRRATELSILPHAIQSAPQPRPSPDLSGVPVYKAGRTPPTPLGPF